MKLNTINGATLMSQPIRPPNFVMDTLLAQGLHILAGSPKVGKSWLALWLAVTVAKGEPVWNMTTKQGTTLYLCLEDSVLRIQNRLFEITEDAPDSVHFCTECALIGQGLEEQVETFLTAHPDTVLVIIDTLQMVRPVHDATYANDYRDLSVLKHLADRGHRGERPLPSGAAQDADGPVYRLLAGTRGSSDLCHRRSGHRLG